MTERSSRRVIRAGRANRCGQAALATIAMAVCTQFASGPGGQAARAQTNFCASAPLSNTPTLPKSFNSFSQAQVGANCIAWQQFIALNWQSDPENPGSPDMAVPWTQFGAPGNPNPTVWMSYRSSDSIFHGATAGQHNGLPVLHALSELDDTHLVSIGQAGNGKWLTSQLGKLTYYEVRINPDEEAYILHANPSGAPLTSAASQQSCARDTAGFQLPVGYGQDKDCAGTQTQFGSNQGTIQIKAAWVALPSDGSLNDRFLTMQGQTQNPVTGELTTHTLGLVGLHIIRRLPGANQFLWSTFEQIDNDPDYNGGSPTGPSLPDNPNIKPRTAYTYFNPSCDPNTDPYQCQINALPGTPRTKPGQNDCVPYTAPNQVARMVAVVAQANNVTGQVWTMLPPKSVFNYYRLIDVQWPAQNAPIPPQSTAPLSTGNIQPTNASRIVSNTTLETYVQTSKSCMDCHKFAPLASPQAFGLTGHEHDVVFLESDALRRALQAGTAPFAADYSFVFDNDAGK